MRPRRRLENGRALDLGVRGHRTSPPLGCRDGRYPGAFALASARGDWAGQRGRGRRGGRALRGDGVHRRRMLLRRRSFHPRHLDRLLRHRTGHPPSLRGALPHAHALRGGRGDPGRERRRRGQLRRGHARHRAHRRACGRRRLRRLGHVAARLCGGARLGARPLSGAAIRSADAALAQAVRPPGWRARRPRRPGAQRGRERGGGGLVSRRGHPPHGSRMIAGEAAYAAFAARIRAGGGISDPWLEGRPRFHPDPVVLAAAERAALSRAAEEMAAAWNELCLLCAAQPELVSGFLGLSEVQQALWLSSAPHWHGVARADLFLTAEGPRICELNCDTPSGEAEAVLLNRAAARPGLTDPNEALEERFCAMIEHLGRSVRRTAAGPLSIGIVYPTEMTEDLSMVLLYRQWFEKRGFRV